MDVGKRIKNRRKELGMSAEDVAESLGVSPATVYRYESKEIMNMGIDKLEPLAAVLRTTPAYLMGWEDAPQQESPLPEGAKAINFSDLQRIPILGRIAAGLPLYAEENIEGYTYTDLNHGGEYFALRVKGDSMDALGIREGYIVIVRKQPMVENGEIAVVLVDHENATMKRFYRTGSTITLLPQSTNPNHQPQIYDLCQTNIEVIGKVVKVEFTL